MPKSWSLCRRLGRAGVLLSLGAGLLHPLPVAAQVRSVATMTAADLARLDRSRASVILPGGSSRG